MNHVQILKRSWQVLWSYKALWVFGVLLALTTAQASSGGNGTRFNVSPGTYTGGELTPQQIEQLPQGIRDGVQQLAEWMTPPFPREVVNTVVGIAIALICLAVVVCVLSVAVQYVSRTALIRMVDRYDGSGEKVNWRAGLRLGWSRPAWRLFLIDLLIFLPMLAGVLAILAVAAAPLLISLALGGIAPIAGVVMTIGLGFLTVFVVILAVAAVAMARELFHRECVVRGRGVIDSFRYGFAVLRANLKDVFLLWLLLLAVQIGFAVVLIPVEIVLFVLGLAFGGGAGVALYLVLQGGSALTALIAAAVVGGLILLAVVGIPSLVLRGWRETYLSTAWTLGYRELPGSVAAADPS